jgi:WD40 repeat protein/serine/threonine protein kinase
VTDETKTTFDELVDSIDPSALATESMRPSGTAPISTDNLKLKSFNCASPEVSDWDSEDIEYDLLEVIGEGGMGVVYSARQTSLGRVIALKRLKGKRSDDHRIRSQFLYEASITGALAHPNIIPVHELGQDHQGVLFYTMKQVGGTSWADELRNMTDAENIEVLLKVCDAISFAHDNSVIHRDLKPSNIMLGSHGEVLVADWGLAMPLVPKGIIKATSGSSLVAGTPTYMAPEMAKGEADRIGIASDVYLLGAILFEVITGKPPHPGKTAAKCLVEAKCNHLRRSKRKDQLMTIALRAMSTEPELRHENVVELRNELRSFQTHVASIDLSSRASSTLADAEATGDYELFARALFGYDEALSLWAGNDDASGGRVSSRGSYARCARDRGDLDLAASLLLSDEPSHMKLASEIAIRQRELLTRQHLIKVLTGASIALTVAVIVVLAVAFFWVRAERNRTAQAYRAEAAARSDAETNAHKARELLSNAYLDEAEALLDERDFSNAKKYVAASLRVNPDNPYSEEFTGKDRELYDIHLASSMERSQSVLYGAAVGQILSAESVWAAHRSTIQAIAISPDGQHLVSGGDDGAVKLWEFPSGVLVDVLGEQTGFVTRVAFSPDNEWIAAGGRWEGNQGGSVKLWSHSSRGECKVFNGHQEEVTWVSFSPDGKTVASAGRDNRIAFWNVAGPPKQEPKYLELESGVRAIEFSSDSQTLFLAMLDSRGEIWDVATATRTRVLSGHIGRLFKASLSADGAYFATAGIDHTVRLWPTTKDTPPKVLSAHDGSVYGLAWSPDNKLLATGGADGALRLWYLPSLNAAAASLSHGTAVGALSFSPTGDYLASGDNVGRIFTWKINTSDGLQRLSGHEDLVTRVAFSPRQSRFASAAMDGTIRLWNLSTCDSTIIRRNVIGPYFRLDFSSDETRLLTGGSKRVAIYEFKTGISRTAAIDGETALFGGAFSTDGKVAAVGAGNGDVLRFDASTLAPMEPLSGPRSAVWAVAYSPDGSWLAAAHRNGIVRLWNLKEDTPPRYFRGHEDLITRIAFSPDSALLASAGKDKTIRLWDVASGQARVLLGHPEWVNQADFSADGTMLASICDGGQLRLWDVQSGELLQLIKHKEHSFSVAFTADNNRIAAAVGNEIILYPVKLGLWQRSPAEIKAEAEKESGTPSLFE